MDLYNIYNENKNEYPIIVNIPHSGTYIPKQISNRFTKPKPIIANNDWFLNELYNFLINMKVTIISANFSRYVVDLNRIITNPIIGDNYNKYTIYKKTTWGKELYDVVPDEKECNERLEKYYYPYHNKLKELINKKLEKFDKILILDLHSGYSSTGDKDICLGNANGDMSHENTINRLKKCFEDEGYTVNLNTPCTGGKVLRKYHNENNKIECILFELNYKKYIKNQYSGEEEILEYDENLFSNAKIRLKLAFTEFLKKSI